MKAEIHLKYDALINNYFKPFFKNLEFNYKGNTFILYNNEILKLLHFQKSYKSSVNEIIFTINIGIASFILFKFFSYNIVKPKIEDCHWRQRLGFFLPKKNDLWWKINGETNIILIFDELKNYFENYVNPEIKKYSNNIALRDLWLSGKSPGLTDFQRLMNLLILIKYIGPNEIFNKIVDELRSKYQNQDSSLIESHIKDLITTDL